MTVGSRATNDSSTAVSVSESMEIILAEARQKAEEIVWERVLWAEQQAWDTIEETEKEAEKIKRLAQDEAEGIIAEARMKSEAAERQAQQILNAAMEKVDSITALAKEEAGKLIAEVKTKAERMAELRVSRAEEEGQCIIEKAVKKAEAEARRIVDEAVQKAETEAQHVKQEAERMLLMSRKLGEEEVKDQFNKFCEELVANTEYIASRKETLTAQVPVDKKESPVLYDGTVELAIKPPVALDRIVKLHRHLRATPQIRVMRMKATKDKGLRMQLLLKGRTPLLDILRALPEVKAVSTRPQNASKVTVTPAVGAGGAASRITVTTRG